MERGANVLKMAYIAVRRRLDSKGTRPNGRRDLLSRFVEARDDNGDIFPLDDILSWSTSPLSAGSDSTAAGLRAIIYYISTNPDVHAKFCDWK